MGLRIQLGHCVGDWCPNQRSAHRDFVLIAENGLHLIHVDFCGCRDAPEPYEQLLDYGWWPTSSREPQSAVKMSCLRLAHILNLQGKLPPTDFYLGLEQLDNGHGLAKKEIIRVRLSRPEIIDLTYVSTRTVKLSLCWSYVNGVTRRW